MCVCAKRDVNLLLHKTKKMWWTHTAKQQQLTLYDGLCDIYRLSTTSVCSKDYLHVKDDPNNLGYGISSTTVGLCFFELSSGTGTPFFSTLLKFNAKNVLGSLKETVGSKDFMALKNGLAVVSGKNNNRDDPSRFSCLLLEGRLWRGKILISARWENRSESFKKPQPIRLPYS